MTQPATPAKKQFGDEETSIRFISFFGEPADPDNFKSAPMFDISIWNNNPRFTIRSNNPKEDKLPGKFDRPLSKTPSQIPLNPVIMDLFLANIIRLAEGKVKFARKFIRNKGYLPGKSKANGDKLEVVSALAYGLRDDGYIYFDAKFHGRDGMRWVFKSPYFHEIEVAGELDGKDSKKEAALEAAKHWAIMTREQLNRCYFHNYVNASNYKPKFKSPNTMDSDSSFNTVATEIAPKATGELTDANALTSGDSKPAEETTTTGTDW